LGDLLRIFWKLDELAQPVNREFHFRLSIISSEVETLLDKSIQRFLESGRNDKVVSCELAEKAQIVLRKKPNIRNIEQDHSQPIHAQTERVTCPLFGIVSVIITRLVDRFKNCGMYDA